MGDQILDPRRRRHLDARLYAQRMEISRYHLTGYPRREELLKMANNSPYNAYLTRRQIYRALFSNFSATEEKLVLQPFDGQDQLPQPNPELFEMESDLLLELAEARGVEYGQVSSWKYQFLGTNLEISQMFTAANIGERGMGPQRAQWWNILSGVKALLDTLVSSAAATTTNPPSFQIETLTDAETGEDTGAVASASAAAARPTLLVETQDILNRFRSVVYAPNSQEQNIRQRYFDAAYASTPSRSRIIPMTNNIYINNHAEFTSLRRWAETRPQPDLFTFNNPEDNYTKQAKYVGTRLIVRLCALHNALFGSNIIPFASNITLQMVGLQAAQKMLANCQAGLQILLDDIQSWVEGISAQADALEAAQEEVIEEAIVETGFSIGRLDSAQIDIISNNEKYKEYFSTTFNQDLITAVPLIHNLYLTTKYFPEVEDIFLGPKNTALDLLRTTITGDEGFPTEPDLSRPASETAIAESNGLSPEEFGLNAGKFILKMLINAPIQILKGLVELIDPHVLVTKLIKVGSATGFQKAAKTLDAPAEVINTRLKDDLELESNLTGKNLMSLILCLADYGFEVGEEGIQAGLQSVLGEDFSPPGNFFPDISMKGIDFTGTVTGMLMIPPTPLGLIYLLLELVKSEIDGITLNVDDAAAENAEDNQC